MEKSLIEQTPFDQFSRQYQVAEQINSLRKKGEKFKILDVGGYKGKTADFLPDDVVIVMDLFEAKEENYVKGSALDMPFKDRSFDFIVSFDVLEHIEKKNRKVFIDECNRVASRAFFICAPHMSKINEESETILNSMYKKLHGKDHEWLKEHIDYTIPDFEQMEKIAEEKKLYIRKSFSNKTYLWLAMQQAIFLNSKYPLGAQSLVELNKFYNQNLKYDGGAEEDETYRIILCCFRQKADHAKTKAISTVIDKETDGLTEIQLISKIGDYYMYLAEKMGSVAKDYEEMYKHEQNRALKLEEDNKVLWARINYIEDNKLKNKLKKYTERILHRVTFRKKS